MSAVDSIAGVLVKNLMKIVETLLIVNLCNTLPVLETRNSDLICY